MNSRLKFFAACVFVDLTALTCWAMIQHPLSQWLALISEGGWIMAQLLVDLVIACVICCGWIVKDARERAQNPAPFVALTVLGGSLGPLLYLIMRRPLPEAAASCSNEPDASGKRCLKCFNPMTWGGVR